MTADVTLSKVEQDFLAACNTVQALGFYPSPGNCRKYASYWIPTGYLINDLRDRLVAKGVLVLTTKRCEGRVRRANTPLTDDEQAVLMQLSLAEPRVGHVEIREAFVAETGRQVALDRVTGWVNRIRDDVDMGPDNPRYEAAVKLKIHEELHEPVAVKANRILELERQRTLISKIDSLSPAEASRLILADWKRRFGKKKVVAEVEPTEFNPGAYTSRCVSRRMELERGSSRRHCGSTFIREAEAG